MYLMYLDESGCPNIDTPRKYPESDFFILAGLIIKEDDYTDCKERFEEFKREKFPEDIVGFPIHAVYLNQVGYSSKNPYNDFITIEEGKTLLKDCYNFVSTLPIEALAVMIDNVEHRKQYSSPIDPYKLCYKFVLERFQRIIAGRNEKQNIWGTVNIEKCSHKLARKLNKLHDELLEEGGEYDKFDNIFRRMNIERGEKSPFYEIADMICYAFQREYYHVLCEKMGKPHAKYEGYLGMIKDICTLNIGRHVWKELGVPLKVFPRPRQF